VRRSRSTRPSATVASCSIRFHLKPFFLDNGASLLEKTKWLYIHTHIYIYVCVFVCINLFQLTQSDLQQFVFAWGSCEGGALLRQAILSGRETSYSIEVNWIWFDYCSTMRGTSVYCVVPRRKTWAKCPESDASIKAGLISSADRSLYSSENGSTSPRSIWIRYSSCLAIYTYNR